MWLLCYLCRHLCTCSSPVYRKIKPSFLYFPLCVSHFPVGSTIQLTVNHLHLFPNVHFLYLASSTLTFLFVHPHLTLCICSGSALALSCLFLSSNLLHSRFCQPGPCHLNPPCRLFVDVPKFVLISTHVSFFFNGTDCAVHASVFWFVCFGFKLDSIY